MAYDLEDLIESLPIRSVERRVFVRPVQPRRLKKRNDGVLTDLIDHMRMIILVGGAAILLILMAMGLGVVVSSILNMFG